ncbi:hypothetical protein AB1N83_013074 [Pleurotus pulmonarius]
MGSDKVLYPPTTTVVAGSLEHPSFYLSGTTPLLRDIRRYSLLETPTHDTSTSAYDSTVITHPSSITSPRDVDFQFEPADGWIDNNRGRALDHVALIHNEFFAAIFVRIVCFRSLVAILQLYPFLLFCDIHSTRYVLASRSNLENSNPQRPHIATGTGKVFGHSPSRRIQRCRDAMTLGLGMQLGSSQSTGQSRSMFFGLLGGSQAHAIVIAIYKEVD